MNNPRLLRQCNINKLQSVTPNRREFEMKEIIDEIADEKKEDINTKDANKEFKDHIVLLGDSILDNRNYVASWKHSSIFDIKNNDMYNTEFTNECDDILQILRSKIVRLNWCATNCAVDGAVTKEVIEEQIETIPDSVTVIILSCGGNDGLGSLYHLEDDKKNWLPWNLLKILYDTRQTFKINYLSVLKALKEKFSNVKIVCCTIYYPVFQNEPLTQIISNIGINILSGVIIGCAVDENCPIIDLRHVFDRNLDYANSIEPGIPGGDKLTNNIVHIVENHDFNKRYRKRDLIYKLKNYTIGVNPKNYGMFYWKPGDNEEQNGNATTKFFRRAFNERENRSICCSCKICCIVCCIVIILACVFGTMK